MCLPKSRPSESKFGCLMRHKDTKDHGFKAAQSNIAQANLTNMRDQTLHSNNNNDKKRLKLEMCLILQSLHHPGRDLHPVVAVHPG